MKSDDNVLGKGIEAIFEKTAHLRQGNDKTLELPNGTIRRMGNEILIRLIMDDEWDIRGAVEELSAAAQAGMLDQLVDAKKMRSNLEDHLEMARLALEENDLETAQDEYVEALKMEDHTHIRFNLAIIYEDLNKHDAAAKQYRKIIKADPSFYQALNNLGLIYYKKGNFTKAMDLFQKAVQIEPRLSEMASGGELLAPRFGYRKIKLSVQKDL